MRSCLGRLLSESWQTSLPAPLTRLGHRPAALPRMRAPGGARARANAAPPSASVPERADASGDAGGACGVKLADAVQELEEVLLPRHAWLASSDAAYRKPLAVPEAESKAGPLAAAAASPSTTGVAGCEALAHARKLIQALATSPCAPYTCAWLACCWVKLGRLVCAECAPLLEPGRNRSVLL